LTTNEARQAGLPDTFTMKKKQQQQQQQVSVIRPILQWL
tara:strand:- start:4716 stop:4832 length:117 start_codon:yes stop_codon:yes gene_type:complete